MSGGLAFLAAFLALPACGAAAAFHPGIRDLPPASRAAIAFGAGATLLAAEATLFSLVGIPWSRTALTLPLLAASALLAALWRRRPALPAPSFRPALPVALAAAAAATLGMVHLGLALATSWATSPDYLLFWGLKGLRFARAAGIDADFLRWPFALHTHTNYPPLVPSTYAWGILWEGRLPWRLGLLTTLFWLAAAALAVAGLLRRRLEAAGAAAVAAFWTAAMAVSLAHSFSGGNAEAPLLFFLTLAGLALLVEGRGEGGDRFLPALALGGAVLTKNEGLIGASLLILGTLARDLAGRRPRALRRALPLLLAPALALAPWILFEWSRGLPLLDPARERAFALGLAHLGEIAAAFARNLGAGTWGLSWLLPLGMLAARRGRLVPLLPGLALTAGLAAFAFFYYLHFPEDPTRLVQWTLPRLIQPALSLLILSAALAAPSRGPAGEG